MKKGLAAPVLIFLFGIFAICVAVALGIPTFLNRDETDVQGVSVIQPVQGGFSVLVSSNGTWDLFEFLCEDEACLNAPNAGKRYATISGGATKEHEVVIKYSPEIKNYKYVKMIARPGWGAESESYEVFPGGNFRGVEADILKTDNGVHVLKIPTEKITSGYYERVAVFNN